MKTQVTENFIGAVPEVKSKAKPQQPQYEVMLSNDWTTTVEASCISDATWRASKHPAFTGTILSVRRL